MNALIAQLVLALPALAVILPLVAGAIAIGQLWRRRHSPGNGLAFPLAMFAVIATVSTVVALVGIQLGHMFSPQTLDTQDLLVGLGAGPLVALSGLAAYTALRRRGAGAGIGFLLGPLVLIAGPLAFAATMQELARGSISSAYMDEARARGSHLAVAVDGVTASTGLDGQIDEVRLHVTVTSDVWLSLVPSDQEIEWGLMSFRLVPPGAEQAGWLYASSPVGEPAFLQPGVPVDYVLAFTGYEDTVTGAGGTARQPGHWELIVSCIGNHESYEHAVNVAVMRP